MSTGLSRQPKVFCMSVLGETAREASGQAMSCDAAMPSDTEDYQQDGVGCLNQSARRKARTRYVQALESGQRAPVLSRLWL